MSFRDLLAGIQKPKTFVKIRHESKGYNSRRTGLMVDMMTIDISVDIRRQLNLHQPIEYTTMLVNILFLLYRILVDVVIVGR